MWASHWDTSPTIIISLLFARQYAISSDDGKISVFIDPEISVEISS